MTRQITTTLLLLIVFLHCFLSPLFARDLQNQDSFKILITIPWGNDPMCISGYENPESPVWPPPSPCAICVSKNGDIFVFNAVDYRILRFSSAGKYKSTLALDLKTRLLPGESFAVFFKNLRLDDDENIYVESFYGINKYNKHGKYITTFFSSTKDTQYIKDYISKLGSPVRAKAVNSTDVFKYLFPKQYFEIKGYMEDALSFSLLSYSGKAPFAAYKVIMAGTLLPDGISNTIANNGKYYKSGKASSDGYSGNDFYAITVKADMKNGIIADYIIKDKISYWHPLFEDQYENFYVYVAANQSWIYKFNSMGTLIAKVEIKNIPYIDAFGNIYDAVWDDKCVKILKWGPKPN